MEIAPCGPCVRMLFVALVLTFLAVLVLAKRLAFGVFFLSAGCAVAGGLFINPDDSVSLRFVTLDETPHITMREEPLGLTGAGHHARSLAILSRRNELAELREHIRYELRRGNITLEKATTLNHLIDEIDRESAAVVGQVAVRHQNLAELMHSQVRLNETLADTIKLVKVLDSVPSPEFAGTFIAAKIQVVRLLAEKAAVDGSIDEIRQMLKRPKAG